MTTPPKTTPSVGARPFQLELLEKALSANVIACVPTGGGKTFISILLLRETASRRRGKSTTTTTTVFSNRWKKKFGVFLVNTVALVSQQAAAIRQHTDEAVGEYSGTVVEGWKKYDWEKEFERNTVLVMTAEIFRGVLALGYLNLSEDVEVLIFDECHHCRGRHPYNAIMEEFYFRIKNQHSQRNIEPSTLPKIFGMTASPLNLSLGRKNLPNSQGKLSSTTRWTEVNINLSL